MESFELKLKLLYYWRFLRNFKYVGTEVGPYKCDVLVSNGLNSIIEFECKISSSDLKNDLKKRKHSIYNYNYNNTDSKYLYTFVPTYFYFAIPKYLEKDTKKIIKKNNLPYGIIGIKKTPIRGVKKASDVIKIVKKSKRIGPFSKELQDNILNRMGSELIRAYLYNF